MLGLLSNNGRLLNEFVENPAKYFRVMMGIEYDDEHRSHKVLNEILNRYFSIGDPQQPHQLNKLGEVG